VLSPSSRRHLRKDAENGDNAASRVDSSEKTGSSWASDCRCFRTSLASQSQASGIIKKTDICRRIGSFNALLNGLKSNRAF